MRDLTIVGASFSGLVIGARAAELGLNTLIIERKNSVDTDLRSSGILTSEAFELLKPPLNAVNMIKRINLFSPDMTKMTIQPSNFYRFYTTDLGAVLRKLYEKAKKADVEFRFGESVSTDTIKNTRFLIGADGADSDVASIFGLSKNRHFLIGHEIHIDNTEKNIASDAFNCYFTNRFAKGYIGWVAPYKNRLQIGVAVTKGNHIDIRGFAEHAGIKIGKIYEERSGLIPIGGIVKHYAKDNILLAGDAMGLVSPLSGGGIHTAAMFGFITAEIIFDYLKNDGLEPAKVIKKILPRWRFKKLLRTGINHCPDILFDIGFHLPFFPAFAKKIFFH